MIEVIQLTVNSGEFSLNDLNLLVEAGSYGVLMGETGEGKTTILETICGLRTVTSGTIRVDGRDVTKAAPGDRGIGYVPQDSVLFPTMTVREHLQFGPRLRRRPATEIIEHTQVLAKQLGIFHLLDRTPGKLSGGEAQRVSLGRAVSFSPTVLLLDEPLGALDEETRGELQSFLRWFNREQSATVLHVTHDSEESRSLADVHFELVNGKILTKPTSS